MTRLTLPVVAVSAYLLGRFIERAWWMQDTPLRKRPKPLDEMAEVQPTYPGFIWPTVTSAGTSSFWTCSWGHQHSMADICVMN